MKPFLVHYTLRDRPITARVVGDTLREAEARFRLSHPSVGDIEIVPAPARAPILPRGPVPATVRFTRPPVSGAERERLAAAARRHVEALRAELYPPAPAA